MPIDDRAIARLTQDRPDIRVDVEAAARRARQALAASASGVAWRCEGRWLYVRFPDDAVERSGASFRVRKARDGTRWARLDAGSADDLQAVADESPVFGRLLDRFGAVWAAVAAAHPRGPDGVFSVAKGRVRLYLGRRWEPAPEVAAVIAPRRDHTGRACWVFKAERAARLVAPALRAAGFPGVAGELARLPSMSVDGLDLDADSIEDMARAAEPEDVHTPFGRAVLEDVTELLDRRLPVGVRLHPYQRVGTAFAKLTGYRALIGDAPGLGKTPQSIAALVVDPEKLLPAVVICPSVVYINWQRELAKWAPSLPVHVMPARDSDPPPDGWKGVVVTKTSVLAWQSKSLAAWGPKCLIVDEAQDFRNEAAGQSQALYDLAADVPHVLMLSGTPFKNDLLELRALLNVLDRDEVFASKSAFTEQFTETEEEETEGGRKFKRSKGSKNEDELRARLSRLMIRRDKAQVAKDLPPKTHRTMSVDIGDEGRKQYQRVDKEFENWLREKYAQQLQGDAVEEKLKVSLRAKALTKLGQLRQLVGRLKVPPAIEYVKAAVENQIPLLVFTEFEGTSTLLLEGLRAAGIRVELVGNGSNTQAKQKQAVNDAFERGDLDVVVGTRSMLTGVNYPRAQEVVFVERYWTPADEMQAEDRAHRITTPHPVLITFMHADGTSDDRVKTILDLKRALIERVLGGEKQHIASVDIAGDVLADFLGVRPKAKPRVEDGSVPVAAKAKGQSIARDDVKSLSFDGKRWNRKSALRWLRISGWKEREVRRIRGKIVVEVGDRRPGRYRAVRLAPGVMAVVPR